MTDQPDNDYADTLEAQMIVDWVSEGMTLIDATRALGIPIRTIYDRINANPRFAEAMEHARAAGYDCHANDLTKLVRGEEGFSTGDVKRDRLVAETTMKLLAKWHPKKYGEKLEIEQKSATVAIPVGDDPIAAQRAYEDLMKS